MKKIQSVKGMHDILPDTASKLRVLENLLINTSESFGYNEIRTPILENTDLFAKSIGDGTDIVEKEMYTLSDSKDRLISMRPEGTASCVRAVVENGLQDSINRFWYTGPFFRHERPQKGRYRQFHQFGVELFGIPSSEADFEVLNIIVSIFKNLKMKSPKILINSIGDIQDRNKYTAVLVEYLSKYKNDLDKNHLLKLEKNPLRILDSKDKKVMEIISNAPSISQFISKDANEHFENILLLLDKDNIKYEISTNLVRGLDYYNKTVFEITDDEENTQNTICAGGRYDYLFETLGQKSTPAVGFAIGLERFLNYAIDNIENYKNKLVYIICLDQKFKFHAINASDIIRSCKPNIRVVNDFNYSNLKSQLKKANKLSADLSVIIGSEEVNSDSILIKSMDTGDQEKISMPELGNYFKKGH